MASHPALASLGEYSFAVYLLQWPVRRLCQRLVIDVRTDVGCLTYFICLVGVAIGYTEKVEKPVVALAFKALRKWDPPVEEEHVASVARKVESV